MTVVSIMYFNIFYRVYVNRFIQVSNIEPNNVNGLFSLSEYNPFHKELLAPIFWSNCIAFLHSREHHPY